MRFSRFSSHGGAGRSASHRLAIALCSVAILGLTGIGATRAAAQDPGQTPATAQSDFGGTYADLEAHQQAFFDDFIVGYNDVMGADLEPDAAYDDLPSSMRTVTPSARRSILSSISSDSTGRSSAPAETCSFVPTCG